MKVTISVPPKAIHGVILELFINNVLSLLSLKSTSTVLLRAGHRLLSVRVCLLGDTSKCTVLSIPIYPTCCPSQYKSIFLRWLNHSYGRTMVILGIRFSDGCLYLFVIISILNWFIVSLHITRDVLQCVFTFDANNQFYSLNLILFSCLNLDAHDCFNYGEPHYISWSLYDSLIMVQYTFPTIHIYTLLFASLFIYHIATIKLIAGNAFKTLAQLLCLVTINTDTRII